MAEKTVVLNARMDPEVKDAFTEVINRIMEENELKRAGDAYAVLVEKIKEQENEIVPDFKAQVKAVKTNTKAILSNVLSMNDIFVAFMENRKQTEEKTQNHLMDKISRLTLENDRLKKYCEDYQDKFNELLQEKALLQKELEECRKQLSRQDKLESMLNAVSSMLADKQGQAEEVKEEAAKPLPGQLNITDYEAE